MNDFYRQIRYIIEENPIADDADRRLLAQAIANLAYEAEVDLSAIEMPEDLADVPAFVAEWKLY